MEFLDYEGLKLYHDLLMDRMHAEIDAATVEVSDISVPFTSFNSPIYSLTLDYDDDNKLYIKVMKDLKYDLNLVVSPGYVWYGSDPTVTFDVIANDYTRDAKGWAFGADGITSASYDKLDPKESQTFSHTYSDVTANITGTLTVDSASTVTVQCIKPILCTTSSITAGTNYTDFAVTAGYANISGSLTYTAVKPSGTVLYIGVPGDEATLKYKSGTSDNESPRKEKITIKINGQDLTYSTFECSVTSGAEFKIYK